MTVAQLIKSLKKYPQDSIVTVLNENLFIDGEYEATSIETYDCATVTICTDYKHRLEG